MTIIITKVHGRESNSRLIDHKSDALPTTVKRQFETVYRNESE